MARGQADSRCPPERPARRALPVAGTHVRASRMGRWRAAVLIGVHVVAAIHIAHWLSTGSTLSPVEPSEAMQFSQRGVINAGFIFFALAIGSTLVLGRWFCGWGCHLVALQDLCRWLLLRVGIRPHPVRSQVLMLIPLLAFLYMFIAPLVYRALRGGSIQTTVALTTEHFWETFPSWIPAALTFAVCGFAAVYFLGQKGFCTTACPYGGVFGLVDHLAPMRIRVTDDCNQCGHCTAVCSSSVRVHEEVRDFGAVVDPGCMKCLDCVSVCPNHALYVGFGRPGVATAARGAPSKRAAAREVDRARAADGWRWVALLVFSMAALLVFTGHDRAYAWSGADVAVSLILAGAAVAMAWMLRPRNPQARRAQFSLGEEALLGGLFLATLAAYRGLYGLVAFLFALGLAALLAFLLSQPALLLMRANLSLGRWRLKRGGRLLPAGIVFLGATALLAGLTIHSAAVSYHVHALGRTEARLHAAAGDARQVAGEALRLIRTIDRIAIVPGAYSPLTAARLAALAGESAEQERRLVAFLARSPGSADALLDLAGVRLARGRQLEAIDLYRRAAEASPERPDVYVAPALLLAGGGDFDEACGWIDRGMDRARRTAPLLVARGSIEASRGDLATALPWFQQAVEREPDLAAARSALGRALLELGRAGDALEHLERALALGAEDAELRVHLAMARRAMRDMPAAAGHLRRAVELAPGWPLPLRMLAEIAEAHGDSAGAARLRERAAALEAGRR